MPKILILLVALLSFSSLAFAKVNNVTLYYDGALVECEESIQANNTQQVSIVIPMTSDKLPDFKLDGFNILNRQYELVSGQKSPKYQALEKELNKLITVREQSYAKTRILDNKQLFLAEQISKFSTEDSFDKNLSLYEEKIKIINEEVNTVIADRSQLENKITQIYDELNLLQEDTQLYAKVDLTLDKTVQKDCILQYSYFEKNARWQPNYKVYVSEKQADLILEAQVSQSTLQDWENTPISLVNLNFSQRSYLPEMSEWIIYQVDPSKVAMPKPMAMQARSADMKLEESATNLYTMSPAPIYSEEQNYISYSGINISLKSGQTTDLRLSQETIPASLRRSVRPFYNTNVILLAELEIADKNYLPAKANIYLDNKYLSQSYLKLTKEDNKIALGTDYLVLAEMKRLTQQKGQSGFIDKKQDYSWDWLITIQNQHEFPIDIRVEDSVPQSQVQSLQLSVESKPQPKVEENSYIWDLKVEPKASTTISQKIKLSAPKDLQINTGR